MSDMLEDRGHFSIAAALLVHLRDFLLGFIGINSWIAFWWNCCCFWLLNSGLSQVYRAFPRSSGMIWLGTRRVNNTKVFTKALDTG